MTPFTKVVRPGKGRRGDVYCKPVGIVDPFLKEGVKPGERFYCFLFPGTVEGMRHHWQHPAFDGPPAVPANESEAWLRTFAEKWNFDYDEMLAAATAPPSEYGNYVVARGIDIHYASDLEAGDEQLFWQHVEALVGKRFDKGHRKKLGWSCSC